MKKIWFLSAVMIFMILFSACGKSGKESIAENDSLARILGTGAAGSGSAEREQVVADLPDVDSANMRSNATEGVTYFKLVDGIDTVVDAGDYTVGMADKMCSIKVMDSSGEVVQAVTIGAQGDGSSGPIKSAAFITVPDKGSVISVGGTCIAQKR